jgi:hypothetical protein
MERRVFMTDDPASVPDMDAFQSDHAYCLTFYRSEDGRTEMLWNPRDSDPPPMIWAPNDADTTLHYVDLGLCVRDKDYVPTIGERVLQDWTPELLREATERTWKQFEDRQQLAVLKRFGTYERAVPALENFLRRDMPGVPVVVTQEWLDEHGLAGKPATPERREKLFGKLPDLERQGYGMKVLGAAIARYTEAHADEGETMQKQMRFVDRDLNTLTFARWLELVSDADYCRVRRSRYGTIEILSRWVGCDPGDGYVYNTMISGIDTNGTDDEQHYPTKSLAECQAMHETALRKMRVSIDVSTKLFRKLGLAVPEDQAISDSETDN